MQTTSEAIRQQQCAQGVNTCFPLSVSHETTRTPTHAPVADWAGPAGLGCFCVHRAGKRPLQLQPSSHGRLLRKRNRQRSDKFANLRSTMKDRQG